MKRQPTQNLETLRMNVRFTKDLHEWLRQESIRTGQSMSTLVANAAESYRQQVENPTLNDTPETIIKQLDRVEELVKQLTDQKHD